MRDDVYLHIEAGTAPTCPDCAATGAAMKMRRCTPPPGAFACDFCTTVFAPLFVAQADGTVGRPRVQLRAEVRRGATHLTDTRPDSLDVGDGWRGSEGLAVV